MKKKLTKLLILGAGGHGKVVADAACLTSQWDQIGFLDDRMDCSALPYKIFGTFAQLPELIDIFSAVVVAIGNNKRRERLLIQTEEMGFTLATIIHPQACVSKYAIVEKGTVIFAQAVVNAYAKIGFGSIINTAAIIEHDCVLGTAVHVSPNAALAGAVKVGNYSWVGIGSNIIEKVTVGANVIVGAGSVVIKDVPDNSVVVGVPANVIKKNAN